MARKVRICVPGAIHHVTAQIVENRILFRDDSDKQTFSTILQKHLKLTGFELLSFDSYDTHYHMILRINQNSLQDLFRPLHSSYATYYNKKYRHNGYFFQGRPKSYVVQDGEFAQKLVGYVHTGPVRAGFCTTLEELDKYPGSHGVVNGNKKSVLINTQLILSLFGNNPNCSPQTLYRKTITDFIENPLSDKDFYRFLKASNKDSESIYQPGYWVIGSRKFVHDAFEQDRDRRTRVLKYRIAGWGYDNLEKFVISITSSSIKSLAARGRQNPLSQARKLFCHFAINIIKMSRIGTANQLGISRTAATNLARAGKIIAEQMQLELPSDPK